MIYEYREYHVVPGRMPDIQNRFASITMSLFKKHGIRVVGFWDTVIGDTSELVYICQYDDLAHRERAWAAFMADPEWQAAKKATEANGPLVERVVNKIWKPTPFSPLQ
ncbi:MAG TPA: NIPSNAP family protein [Candidatus Tectomicrobia bacterium]|nr:NIPSNAP family protein [Candidatus Tectomicrobia bacterium]